MSYKLSTAQSVLTWVIAGGAYYAFSTQIYPQLFPQPATKATTFSSRDLEEFNTEKKKELVKKGAPPL